MWLRLNGKHSHDSLLGNIKSAVLKLICIYFTQIPNAENHPKHGMNGPAMLPRTNWTHLKPSRDHAGCHSVVWRLTFTGQTAWVTGPRNRTTMGARKSLLADQRKPPMHGRLEHNVVPLGMKGVLIPLIDSGRTPQRGQPGPSTNSTATIWDLTESFSSEINLNPMLC